MDCFLDAANVGSQHFYKFQFPKDRKKATVSLRDAHAHGTVRYGGTVNNCTVHGAV